MQDETSSKEAESMPSSHLESIFQEIEQQKDAETKLQLTLSFMEKALSSEKTPDFKVFWEMRKKCLELFKEHLPSPLRTQYWRKFSELSKEVRRLKDLLDEQSEFAAEQIEIAIKAIESDLEQMPQKIQSAEDTHLPQESRTLARRYEFYNGLQKELNLLNFLASQITALRKELIKTEMRIRKKNQFFDRLSKIGDAVFPRRKELIKGISDAIEEDVESFIQANFSQSEPKQPLFAIREEIKALQSAAKLFTLNTQSFGSTRLKLSACWDQIKEKDKERKQIFEKKRELFKQNAEELKGQIQEAIEKFDAGTDSLSFAQEELDRLANAMQTKELGREEVKEVRSVLQAFREKVQAKRTIEEEERKKQEELREQKVREIVHAFEQKLNELASSGSELSMDHIIAERGALITEIQASDLSRSLKNGLEKLLKPIDNLIVEKKEQMLLNLPADLLQALEQLRELKKQKNQQRNEIESQMKALRKSAGSSGLDFQKAMEYNERLGEEKEKLEKVCGQIKGLEEKIGELEQKAYP